MNLRSIDLNLLVIFNALISEKSLTAAARRIGISQSATSHALRRLRETFQDDLLERTPRGMIPTRRALELAKSVHPALQVIQKAVEQQLEFQPQTSERTFRITVSDYLMAGLLPRLVARVQTEAPAVTLKAEYPSRSDDQSIEERGDIELRTCADAVGPDYHQRQILRNPFVIAMRRDHPIAAEEMTLDRYLTLPHIDAETTISGPRALDEQLARRGLRRRVAMTVPSLSGVIPIVQQTDLCTVLPMQWVKLHSEPGTLVTAPLPLDGIEFTIDIVWHRRDDADPGCRWLRALIEQEYEALPQLW
jgi:DNA-binding transcriptional LysR family regulator